MIGVGKFVRCLDRKYHTACLKCVVCRSVLGPEDDIFNKGGDPACSQLWQIQRLKTNQQRTREKFT
jgi:hypothetical protein